MTNSLRKIMSVALAITMLFSLFVPTAFADETYPTLTMKLVDDNGNDATVISPDADLWIRVSATVANSLYAAGVKIADLEGMKVNTSKSIKKIYESNAAFNTFEINNDTGITITETAVDILFSCKMGAEPTVAFSGEIPFVDIPVKITGAIDDTVAASFVADGGFGVYVFEESDADPYYLDAEMLNVNEISATITQIPYAIEAVALDPEFAAIPLQAADNGYEFPGFGDSKLKATYDLDRDSDSAKDTFSYDIITDLADAPAGAYAYVDLANLNVNAKGSYELDVTVYDSSVKDTNGADAGQFSGKVTVTVTDAAATDKYTLSGAIDVKYGTDAAGVIAAVKALSAADVIKTVYTDGSEIADTNAAAYDLANANVVVASAYNGEVKGAYNVVTIDDANIISGSITVNVKPATIDSIELTPAWTLPQGVAGDAFPGFDDCVVKATFADVAAGYETAEYDIVTDAAANGVAYVNTEAYDASVIGKKALPVVIKDADVLAADYEGNIEIEIVDPVGTGAIKVDADYGYIGINYTDDNDTAVADALAAVEAAIADGLILEKLTNGEYGAVVGVVSADSATPDFDALKVTVSLVIDDADYAWEDGAATQVEVSMGEAPAILSAKFVDAEGADVTPAIKAAIAEYAEAEELAMDWSDYKVLVTYENPNPTATENLTQTYDYYTDGAAKYFVVENWADFEDCKAIGNQTVTIKVYDPSKAIVEGADYAFAGNATAAITAADSANIFELTDATISVKNGTSEEDALEKLYDEDDLFVEIFKDGSKKKADVKITEAEIADYSATVKGEYEVTVVATDADEGATVITDAAIIIKVKAKSSGAGVKAGTVVGGGGKSGSVVADKDEPTTPPTEEPKDEPVVNADPIADDHWAKDVVAELGAAGIIDAAKETAQSIEAELTREEAAKIIVMALGLELTGSVDAYTDAAEIAEEYKAYVAAASAAGIFTGYEDGSFGPKGVITREQLAAVIIRAYGFGEGTAEITFADADKITWAKGYVSKAVELSIVLGYEDNTFRPANSIKRSEGMAIIARAMKLKNALDAAIAE